MLPCCAVIVMVYVPGGVPVLLLTQPQASVLHTTSAASRTSAPRHDGDGGRGTVGQRAKGASDRARRLRATAYRRRSRGEYRAGWQG